jgi:hypothetical protein
MEKKGWAVESIKAVWTNGQIQPLEPVNWPDGKKLIVKPDRSTDDELVPGDNTWGDDAASFDAWAAAVDRIEPTVWAEGEREAFEAFREEVKRYTIEESTTGAMLLPDRLHVPPPRRQPLVSVEPVRLAVHKPSLVPR